MNTSNLKDYAPNARTAFIAAVTQRAAQFGIEGDDKISDVQVAGSVMLINGNSFDAALQQRRQRLVKRVKTVGFNQQMEQVAYTWFNRLCAIRYMELHDYLGHGLRVLSPSASQGEGRGEGAIPEILTHAQDVADDLGMDRNQIIELKLAGNKDEELYRELLLAQCHQLHKAMPFLFEALDDETELLLPDNLTRTDSILRELVTAIPEENWKNIEIIGWLYQFYISEKKDQVIGKVVKSEDIPAATQLFTPNWIVKYMVQNSLGAQWLATYPDSPIKGQMEYYIEPAEQTDEVNAQLAAITPDSLNPEELTLIDPACGSGHILVEGYDLFKTIYLERGYRQRDVAQLILEKNLFGLDIDERAAQLTGFALMMKARADDRRLFTRGIKLNVMALVDSAGFDAEGLAKGVELSDYELKPGDLTELKRLFEHATTFGSLIQVPDELSKRLPALKQLSEAISQDMFVTDALKRLGPLVQQTELLAAQYDAVVANPPYMGNKYQSSSLKRFVRDYFPKAKSDLFACFMERAYTLAKEGGYESMVTMQAWMFLSSFEEMRERLVSEKTISTMAHLGARAFGSISGEVVKTTAFVLRNRPPQDYRPVFLRLLEGDEATKRTAFTSNKQRFDTTIQNEFKKIPGSPVVYSISDHMRGLFQKNKLLGEAAPARKGLTTFNNNEFLRNWSELSFLEIKFDCTSGEVALKSKYKWFPYNKGGEFRKWYGNNEVIVNWLNDGAAVKDYIKNKNPNVACGEKYYFLESISASAISSSANSYRLYPQGALFDANSRSIFGLAKHEQSRCLGLLNSKVIVKILGFLNPTLATNKYDLDRIPTVVQFEITGRNTDRMVAISKKDWDAYERSSDFVSLPILMNAPSFSSTLESSYTAWITENRDTIAEIKRLEEENNRLFIDAYGLADELTPDVPIEQITLTVNPTYRYGIKITEAEQWTRFRQDTMADLVSYAIGCMMGRYSIDKPGLIYAHSGNEGFDPSNYTTFPADDDGIIPLTDTEWFSDDAANRLIKFISVAWDKSHLEENLTFIADNLSPRKSESSRDTLRRYLCTKFFKDHLKNYKKRPIYWLFSSGKQKAFQCLVYLHRYNEGTLARMRTEYVTPLLGKYDAYADQLQHQVDDASSTAAANRHKKELVALEKKQTELQEFDDKLKHYADRRIKLDLDDGVKVNYGKFGDLLAEVKSVHGKLLKVK